MYGDEYEFFMDVKKLWMMSLAFIIAYCLDNVLYEFLKLLEEDEKNEDYYTFEVSKEEGIFYCKFYWVPHPEIVQNAFA